MKGNQAGLVKDWYKEREWIKRCGKSRGEPGKTSEDVMVHTTYPRGRG